MLFRKKPFDALFLLMKSDKLSEKDKWLTLTKVRRPNVIFPVKNPFFFFGVCVLFLVLHIFFPRNVK